MIELEPGGQAPILSIAGMRRPLALIVEDDSHIAEFLAVVTRQVGYETQIATSGQAALRQLLGTVPDLIILDLVLPHLDGADILSWVRKERRFAATRVIVVTAYFEATWQVHDQADVVLLKPIAVEQLCDLASRLRPRAVETDLEQHLNPRATSPAGDSC